VFALRELVFSLLVLHCVWALAYIVGSFVLAPFGDEPDAEMTPGRALFHLVVSSACGFAVLGFGAFVLGLLGLLYAPGLLAILLAAAIFSNIRRTGATTSVFWRQRRLILKKAATPYSAAIWALAILLGIPAVMPDLAYDSQAFLLPQALDWAETHRLSVDTTMRFPYYAQNWLLLYTWFFLFNVGSYTSLLTWLCTILTALGIQSVIADFGVRTSDQARPRAWFVTAAFYAALFAAPLGFLLNPITIRWEWSSMQDIAHGFLFLAFMLSAVAALRSPRDFRPLAAAVVIAGFFVGLKTSLFAFLPLGVIIIAVICFRNRYGGRALAIALAGFIVLSAPWYLRSFALDGDPIAPVLNLKLHGVDKKFTPDDVTRINSDLRLGQSVRPADLLSIPWQLTVHTDTVAFREYGTTLGYIFLYVPFVVLFMALYKFARRRLDAESVVMAMMLAYAIGYWLATSYMARYTLLFGSSLLAFEAYLLLRMTRRPRWGFFAAAVILLVFSVPSTRAGFNFLSPQLQYFDRHYADIYKSRDGFYAMQYGAPSWAEINYIVAFEKRPNSAKRVYAVGLTDWRFNFRKNGITMIGDWFGSERYSDLNATIHLGRFASYARRFGFDAMIVTPASNILSPRTIKHLEEQAAAAGFRTVRLPKSNRILLLRSST